MKKNRLLLFVLATFMMIACGGNGQKIKDLESQIQMLNERATSAYVPGYGEIMGTIQVHHAKLWFAGISQNRELARFEIHELREAFENVEKYHKERPANEHISVIYPLLDSLEKTLAGDDQAAFERKYHSLTNSCNACHQLAHYGYIRICTPQKPVYGNQIFKMN